MSGVQLIDATLRIVELERENAALRADAKEVFEYEAQMEELKSENAALREAVLFFPKCRWKEDAFSPSAWAAIDEKAAANVIMRRALDIARKEAQPCGCTNGIIRCVGRDNEEIIEDCPRCSVRKEAQP